jgi:hypothetical protein
MRDQALFDKIDLHLIRVLHTVLTERSVSRAAMKLGMYQPAVSASLKRLRELAGDPLLYGERFPRVGLFSMQTPTQDLVEIVTGLGATGAEIIVVFDSTGLIPGNPLVPTLQIASAERLSASFHADVDLLFSEAESPEAAAKRIFDRFVSLQAGRSHPRNSEIGNLAFQVTRGLTGISL